MPPGTPTAAVSPSGLSASATGGELSAIESVRVFSPVSMSHQASSPASDAVMIERSSGVMAKLGEAEPAGDERAREGAGRIGAPIGSRVAASWT